MLDAPEWDARWKEEQTKGTRHDAGHFDTALELARDDLMFSCGMDRVLDVLRKYRNISL